MNRCFTLALLLALVLAGPISAQPVQPLHGEEIAAIWKERQDKVKTASFEFTRTNFEPKGGLSKMNPYLIREWSKKHPELATRPIPSKDSRLESPARLVISDGKVRHDYFSEQCDLSSGDYYLQKEQTSFDGKYFRTINGKKGGNDEGAIRLATIYPESNLVALSALLTSIRGRTRGLSMIHDVRVLTFTGRRTLVEGAECLEYLVGKLADGSHSRHVWLAPKWGWQIVRDIGHAPKSDTMDKKEIRYRSDVLVGWIPSNWEYARIVSGEALMQTTFVVTGYSLNESIAEDEFVLKFPAGTSVMDEDAKGGAVVGTVDSRGVITPDDGRQPYYIAGHTPSWVQRNAWYGLLLLILVTALVLFWTFNRRYRRRHV